MTVYRLIERTIHEREYRVDVEDDRPPAQPIPIEAAFARLGTVRRPALSAPRTLLIEDKRAAR